MRVTLEINGRRKTFDLPSGSTLLSALRDYAGLTGTKYGCGEGQCGACAVLVNGRTVQSCVTPAISARGKSITTIEGLAQGEILHPVQRAFLEESAFQCGFCTPGMIIASTALLAANASPSEADVRVALNGHLCRCGTYPRIVQAVRLAAAFAKEQRGG
ncbi:MAG: (2Fe-2S)-binding protein [Bryobacterales bacterium]|nr:(2Fe-2S)-binding protein [Bryobacterales bacterium]